MQKTAHLVYLFVVVSLIGCTPLSQGVVRKANLAPEQLEPQSPALLPSESMGDSQLGLDAGTRTIVQSYGSTIKEYSRRYRFDWRLVLAIMKVESGFAPDAMSEKGATGLMQIMPSTGEELGKVLKIDDITQPRDNIHGGMYYLKQLYDLFDGAEQSDRIKLSLAAYNAGIGRVYDAQDLAAYFHDNPTKWQAVKDALPLLSRRYYTLHRNVWKEGSPKFGWFGDSQQTLTYVDRIMDNYERYQMVLN
jgi:membrane-bound lytic murein transglycosylase F